ncbi:MAG: membrane protein insertase YidC [Hyphomicrobiaceae bacterium]|nr:membrane protein insertase YidC [Hyphomicrobiaceae bacterium]
MTQDNRNIILAILLSVVVMFGWQYFVAQPKLDAGRKAAEVARQLDSQAQSGTTAPSPGAPGAPANPAPVNATPATVLQDRATAIKATARVAIDTPALTGSINLAGGRLDDLSLRGYRATIDPKSPMIDVLTPAGTRNAHFAEFGWVSDPSVRVALPTQQTVWTQEGSGALGVGKPVTLSWDNGAGLVFRRVIDVDSKYLFTVKDTVENKGAAPVTLFPYALVARHGTPATEGFYILHEGLIGVFGDQGLNEVTYKDMKSAREKKFEKEKGAWVGFVDKYWATAIVPEAEKVQTPSFTYRELAGLETYQTDFLGEGITIAPGATGGNDNRVFAGAKEVHTIDGYAKTQSINRFDRLIDWGWFYFLTKPLFVAIDFLYKYFGNFGVAILLVTVALKLLFFPLANKSYASMAKMKKVQPEMTTIRDLHKDDKMKQQQLMMELYKREKINPLSGCLPILIQIPVFFALYKVLFVTIEMRHAPFFGWIHDLSAPDPTSVFNLFGLLPFTPPSMLMLGIWPLIMGVTMFIQMKLNPAPPDPTQKVIFDWMPFIFTFMLASFPAGLVIYWSWNNLLSILQQWYIMRKNDVPVEIWSNIKSTFRAPPPAAK